MDASDRGGLTVSMIFGDLPGAKLAAVRSGGFASFDGCCESERADCDGRVVGPWASREATEVCCDSGKRLSRCSPTPDPLRRRVADCGKEEFMSQSQTPWKVGVAVMVRVAIIQFTMDVEKYVTSEL